MSFGVFGFGTFDPDSKMSVLRKDPSKLEKAPIHNLSSERHVASTNYGLSIHGANQLGIVSSSIVKAKAYDLTELKPAEELNKYRSFSKKGSVPMNILKQWDAKQQQLKKDGLLNKEIKNIGDEKRKNKDLVYLKQFGGPFTSTEEVDTFLTSACDDSTKEKRMYTEVRYARDTSLTLLKSSTINFK